MANGIKNIVLVIGLFLWFIYMVLNTLKLINLKNTLKESYPTYLKNNIWQILRIDKLFLIVIFYIYTQFGKTTVNIYLFTIMILYFLVNSLYENMHFKKIKFSKDYKYLLLMIIIFFLPIIYIIITHKITKTFLILFMILYFLPIIFLLPVFFFSSKKGN